MSRQRLLLYTASLGLLVWLGDIALGTDWYSFGRASPPVHAAVVSPNELHSLNWSTDGESPSADRSVAAGQKVKLAGEIRLDVEEYWWGATRKRVGSRLPADWDRYLRAQAHKPIPMLRAELVSRSSLNSGESVTLNHPLNLRPRGETAATFSVELTAPARPGTYELRLYFGTKPLDKIMQKYQWDDERVVASKSFHVYVNIARLE